MQFPFWNENKNGSGLSGPEPFFVIATQNPLGSAGTQMLPESQMDRFMVLLSMGYPTIKEEMILMSQRKVSDPLDDVNEVISKEELLSMQKEVNEIKVSSLIYKYIAMLSDAKRNSAFGPAFKKQRKCRGRARNFSKRDLFPSKFPRGLRIRTGIVWY